MAITFFPGRAIPRLRFRTDSTLPTSTLSSTIETDGTTVPTYDASSTISLAISGQNVTVSGASNGTAGSCTASFVLNGTTYTCTISSSDTTPASVAADVCTQLTADGVTVSVDGTNTSQLDFDPSYTIGSAQVSTADSSAYVTDKAQIDSGL